MRDSFLSDFDDSAALIYGIGNIGREDDALGWEAIDSIERSGFCEKANYVKSYQLHLEDADLISHQNKVLFIDATEKEEIETFRLSRVMPKIDFTFTSHAISVQSIVEVCRQCFGDIPEVYLLEIRGYSWDLKVGMTHKASKNLEAALGSIMEDTGQLIEGVK